ncbi:PR-1-like protein [Mycena pura]|uniref:PR-1-like protein n=1 Tax=Mycena pura TaxID=153505 RepID=A0AAD7E517_9AGAR|nr:PR-1-like protein [Mycena pura]
MLLIPVLAAIASLTLVLATPASRRHSVAARSHLPDSTIEAYLQAHNEVRSQHNAPALVWNETLATAALGWANTCQVKHSDGELLDTPYGENLVAATGDFPIASAIRQFTLDEADYDPESPILSHFTQVVWKATTQLGCASSHCSGVFEESLGQASYYVCLYDPPGNVIGQALANVQL